MEHSHPHAKDGMPDPESTPGDGTSAARVIELARKARLAQRTAAEFLRRWAVEQAVEEVGLIALRSGMIDLPSSRWMGTQVGSQSGHDS